MAISNYRQLEHGQYRKGFQNGKATCYDQIAAGCGKARIENGPANLAVIFRPSQSTRFYSSPGICDTDTSAVFQDRLPRYHQNSARQSEHQRCHGSGKAAALYHSAKSPAEDAKKNIFQGLLAAIFDYARNCRLIKSSGSHVCSVDSTGMENHYVSRHFLQRKGLRTDKYRRWTKLTVVCDNQSHLIASAVISTGQSTDCHYLRPAVTQAVRNISIDTLLADSGYDAEYNHRLCREEFGIRSTVIQINDRGLKYGYTGGQNRRRMKQRFPAASYRKRWHIESVFSRFKRRLGNALAARTNESRAVECLLRVLTYNLMIVLFTFKKSVTYNLFYKANSKLFILLRFLTFQRRPDFFHFVWLYKGHYQHAA
jgi:transposase